MNKLHVTKYHYFSFSGYPDTIPVCVRAHVRVCLRVCERECLINRCDYAVNTVVFDSFLKSLTVAVIQCLSAKN